MAHPSQACRLLHLLSALNRSATAGSLCAHVAHAVLDVNRHHSRWINPPEFPDDPVAGKPGVRLLEFISHQQFGREDSRVPDDQMRVRRKVVDPGGAGGELIVQHELARSETKSLSATESTHDRNEFLVDDSLWGGCLRKGGWRGDRGRGSAG